MLWVENQTRKVFFSYYFLIFSNSSLKCISIRSAIAKYSFAYLVSLCVSFTFARNCSNVPLKHPQFTQIFLSLVIKNVVFLYWHSKTFYCCVHLISRHFLLSRHFFISMHNAFPYTFAFPKIHALPV